MSKWVLVKWSNNKTTKELVVSENGDFYIFDEVLHGNKQAIKTMCEDINLNDLNDNDIFILCTGLSNLDKFDKSRKQFDYYDLLDFAENYHTIKSTKNE